MAKIGVDMLTTELGVRGGHADFWELGVDMFDLTDLGVRGGYYAKARETLISNLPTSFC